MSSFFLLDVVHTLISELPTHVVDENDYMLFPQLEQPEICGLSDIFFEDFVNINKFVKNDTSILKNDDFASLPSLPNFTDLYELETSEIADEATIAAEMLSEEDNKITDCIISYLGYGSDITSSEMNKEALDVLSGDIPDGNSNTLPIKEEFEIHSLLPDFTDLYALGTPEIVEEATIAVNMLSEEDNEISDCIVSYLENDSAVSSPEMSEETIDILLSSLSPDFLNENYKPEENLFVVEKQTENNILTEILAENTIDEQVLNTSVPNDLAINDEVVNEFVQLLNSLNDCLADWETIQTGSVTNTVVDSSVGCKIPKLSTNLCNTSQDSLVSLTIENVSGSPKPLIDGSVNTILSDDSNISGKKYTKFQIFWKYKLI